jgi:hypothetical protein
MNTMLATYEACKKATDSELWVAQADARAKLDRGAAKYAFAAIKETYQVICDEIDYRLANTGMACH